MYVCYAKAGFASPKPAFYMYQYVFMQKQRLCSSKNSFFYSK
jgi:hypothetical protein